MLAFTSFSLGGFGGFCFFACQSLPDPFHAQRPKPLKTGLVVLKVPKRTDITPEEGSNLYIFGLDPSVTELHLYEAFAGYGAIRSVRVVTDKATGRRKGFAFVQYFNAQDAQSAMLALNGLPVGSKAWTISVQTKKA